MGVFLLLTTASCATRAATYYVATNGSDSGSGSEGAPFRTIAYAVRKMVAGDTTYVRGGVYNEKLIRFSRSGTESAPIKLLAASPNEFPVIDLGPSTSAWSGKASGGTILFQSSSGYNKPIGWITIEGFEIRNGYNGIKFYNLHNSVIRRNWIHHIITNGILGGGGHHILFDRNRIQQIGDFALCKAGGKTEIGTSMCNQQHGLYMSGNSYIVTNNIFDGSLCAAIQLKGTASYTPAEYAGNEFAGGRNWLIANNTFVNQYYCEPIYLWGAGTDGTKVINNIFYENALSRPASVGNGINLFSSSPATGIVINNNLSYSSKGRSFITNGYNNYKEGANYAQSGNIVNTANPNLANPVGGDFQLQTGSPAIDKGLSLSEVTWDHAGGKRPFGAAFDIGAYEFGSPPDSGSPPPNPTGGGSFTPGAPVLLGPTGETCPSPYLPLSIP